MSSVDNLKIKLFADGADKAGILDMYAKPYISGFTTNPTLMRKAGISDYATFAQDILSAVPDRPVSFEVFSDEFDEMELQAQRIAAWGVNVYVKIPITNTRREPAYDLMHRLSQMGIRLNITAMMTLEQVRCTRDALSGGTGAFISVFAGRVADTGRDPVPMMQAALDLLRPEPQLELLWASPREVLNIYQADQIGCPIITVTNDLLRKLELADKDLDDYSLETVKMFYNDAHAAGFSL